MSEGENLVPVTLNDGRRVWMRESGAEALKRGDAPVESVSEPPNRWAAFTDDELRVIEHGLPYGALMGEIADELERRRG